jgi:hypothetical protein
MPGKAGDLGFGRVEFDAQFDARVRWAGQEEVGDVHRFVASVAWAVVGG